MVDVDRQIAHWRAGAQEDWGVALELVKSRRIRHGLFFAHLAIEKALKAHVCQRTQDLAPRTHNLVRLSELARLQPDEGQLSTLADFNALVVRRAITATHSGVEAPVPQGARRENTGSI